MGQRQFQVLTVVALAALLLGGGRAARADEGGVGHYQPGSAGYAAGILAPAPGLYFGSFFNLYEGSTPLDEALPIGGRPRPSVRSFVWTANFSPTCLTHVRVLGGTLGWTANVPLVYLGINSAELGTVPPTDEAGQNFNLGDIYVAPALQWRRGNYHAAFFAGLYTPSGEYRKNQLAPAGSNFWSFEPALGLTYLNPRTGWEFSTFQGIDFNTTNPATEYRSGDDFHVDFTVARHFVRPVARPETSRPGEPESGNAPAPAPPTIDVAPGVGGYCYQQLTGDSGPGAVLGPFKGRVFALGPQVECTAPFAGRPITVQLRLLKEFLAENRTQGLNAWANVAMGL